jgi:hypothetical protein
MASCLFIVSTHQVTELTNLFGPSPMLDIGPAFDIGSNHRRRSAFDALPEGDLDLAVSSDLRRKHQRSKIKKVLKDPVCADEVVANLPTLRIEYKVVAKSITKPMRSLYNSKAFRQAFMEAALEETIRRWANIITPKRLKKIIKHYNIHHKRPICVGGTNNYSNLVLIEDGVHLQIHEDIDRMVLQIKQAVNNHCLGTKPFSMASADGSLVQWASFDSEIKNIRGLTLEYDGTNRRIMMDIPWPKGSAFIPQLFLLELGPQRRAFDASAKLGDKWPAISNI